MSSGTLAVTRHGRKTVMLYNAKTGKYIRCSDWSAEKKLKHDHFANGGRYLKISEIDKYIQIPPPLPKAISAKAPTAKVEKEVIPTNQTEEA